MNARFRYLYRDGANFKRWGEVVFSGHPTRELLERLVRCLDSGTWFVADQVGLPECFFDDWPLTQDDHCFHEYEAVEATEDPVEGGHVPTFSELVERFEAAAREGWRVFDPAERRFNRGIQR